MPAALSKLLDPKRATRIRVSIIERECSILTYSDKIDQEKYKDYLITNAKETSGRATLTYPKKKDKCKFLNDLFKPTIGIELSNVRYRYIEDIKGVLYPRKYIILDCGKIFNPESNRFFSPSWKGGYLSVGLSFNGMKRKNVKIHIIVGLYFCINLDPTKYDMVDHKDRDRNNNFWFNLEWSDNSGNGKNKDRGAYHGTIVYQYNLQDEFVAEFPSMTIGSEATGTSIDSISRCCRMKQKSAVAADGYKYI